MNQPKICFVHLPKTAGSTLRQMLRDNYFPQDIFNGNTMLDYNGKTKNDMESYSLFLGHIYYYKALEILPDSTEYITVLRNPVDRVKSLYFFWRSHSDEYISNTKLPEILRRGPKLAKELDLIDFIQIDDPYIQQSISNNQARQLYPTEIGFRQLDNQEKPKVIKELIEVLKGYAVVGTQELFPFFIYKMNKRFVNKKLYFKNIAKVNVSQSENKSIWSSISDTDKKKIVNIINHKNKIDKALHNYVFNRNLLEINKYFDRHQHLPQLY